MFLYYSTLNESFSIEIGLSHITQGKRASYVCQPSMLFPILYKKYNIVSSKQMADCSYYSHMSSMRGQFNQSSMLLYPLQRIFSLIYLATLIYFNFHLVYKFLHLKRPMTQVAGPSNSNVKHVLMFDFPF